MLDNPIPALDFDGVIADSIHECMVVSFNASRQSVSTSDSDRGLQDQN
ncbi:hypothetical protein KAR48_18810 [bacterium]|nr:hypothetical protein [bacterium]